MNLYEFKQAIFGRAIRYLISPYDLTMKEAEARAAKEIAAEYRIKAAREKKPVTLPTYTPASSDGDDYSAELSNAKDRLFARLHDYFARLDARRARERAVRRAMRKAAKLTKPTPVTSRATAAPVPEPVDEPAPSNVVMLVYSGSEHHAEHISDEGYPPRYQDRTAANWRASIAANELKKSKTS